MLSQSTPHRAVEHARGLTIHVAGRGVFVVMRGKREMFRGTFARCFDYVNTLPDAERE